MRWEPLHSSLQANSGKPSDQANDIFACMRYTGRRDLDRIACITRKEVDWSER